MKLVAIVFVTVTVHVAVLSPAFAVTVAVPLLMPPITPALDTVTMLVLLDDHCIDGTISPLRNNFV